LYWVRIYIILEVDPYRLREKIIGAVYAPADCETLPTCPPCIPKKVFHLHVKGTGTVAVFGEVAEDNAFSILTLPDAR